MKITLLSCLTAAIGGTLTQTLCAQAAPAPAEVRVRMQDPRPGVDMERRLKVVIELLQQDDLTAEQRDRARQSLEELLEHMHTDSARRGTAKAGGHGLFGVSPPAAEGEVTVVEIAETPTAIDVAPHATVRTRVVRVDDGDAAPAPPEAEARVLRKRVARLEAEVDAARSAGPRPPRAPRAPKAAAGPNPPKAPKAPKAPGKVQWKVLDSGEDGTFRIVQQDDADEHVVELEEVHGGVLKRIVHDKAIGEQLRSIMARIHASSEAEDAGPGNDDAAAEHHLVRVLRLAHEHDADGAAQKAHQELKLLVERQRADEADGLARTRINKRVEVVERDDVTDSDDLHEMLDEMRAEMREIRELMQKIRSQAKADQAESVGAAGRLMRH